MQPDPLYVEERPRCKPLLRSRQATGRSPKRWRPHRAMKPTMPARLRPSDGEIFATFGNAELIRHEDGRWELSGGSPVDHAVAREGCSLFQHEATFLSQPAPVTVPQPGTPKKSQTRILIADDDTLVRGSLAAVLESEGYAVDEACDGREAITRAIANKPDLVLLDLNMPQWDGWTAFSQLDRVTPLLPVIVITARPNQYQKAVQLGVDAFMEKPLNIHILMRAIKRLTSEDKNRHERRITNRTFVTQLLAGSES